MTRMRQFITFLLIIPRLFIAVWGLIFTVDTLYVTLSPCKHLYTCKSRRGAFRLQLSAPSWEAAAPHRVSLMMMLGGLWGLGHAATLLLWHCYSRLWKRLHETVWLCLSSYTSCCIWPWWLSPNCQLKKALGLSWALKYARINDENVY